MIFRYLATYLQPIIIGPSFLLLVQKKRSKEKDAFFKEFFGLGQKSYINFRGSPIEKIGLPVFRKFIYLFFEKGIRNTQGNYNFR